MVPMPLARLREPFDHPDWVYEVKLDGFRCVAVIDPGQVTLLSRNGRRFLRWPSLTAALAEVARGSAMVLDGEVVSLDDDGRPNFHRLLFRRDVHPHFYAFDVLALDGEDLRRLPLIQRKRMLRRLIPRGDGHRVRYLGHVERRGTALFDEVCAHDMEGIVAKLKSGAYDPTKSTWVKVKNREYSQGRDRWELFQDRARRA